MRNAWELEYGRGAGSRVDSLRRYSVGGQIGAREIGVAGKRWLLFSVHKKANLGNAGQVGMQGSTDGEHGQRFGLQARGMASDKAAGEIDDCQLGAVVFGRICRRRRGRFAL